MAFHAFIHQFEGTKEGYREEGAQLARRARAPACGVDQDTSSARVGQDVQLRARTREGARERRTDIAKTD